MYFAQKNLQNAMKAIPFKFRRFFRRFAAAFDTDTFQVAEGRLSYPLSGNMIILCVG